MWNTNAPLPQHIKNRLTFDLYLWPTDLKINRNHVLIKDYLPTKFEASGANPSWVISCTRLRETDIPTDRQTDGQTDGHVQRNMPVLSKGRHKYSDEHINEKKNENAGRINIRGSFIKFCHERLPIRKKDVYCMFHWYFVYILFIL